MQATSKELYEEVHNRTGEDLALIKSIGDSVFSKTSALLKNPVHLVLKLKGVGYWYMRKLKLDSYLERYKPLYTLENPVFRYQQSIQQYANNKAQYKALEDRRIEYDEFLRKKARIRAIRRKSQKIRKPIEEC